MGAGVTAAPDEVSDAVRVDFATVVGDAEAGDEAIPGLAVVVVVAEVVL